MGFVLKIVKGAGELLSIAVPNDHELTLGRSAAASLALEDVRLSRRHCAVSRRGDVLRLVDLESGNGTFVNEERLAKGGHAELKAGDKVRIGSIVMEIAVTGALAAAAKPEPARAALPAVAPPMPAPPAVVATPPPAPEKPPSPPPPPTPPRLVAPALRARAVLPETVTPVPAEEEPAEAPRAPAAAGGGPRTIALDRPPDFSEPEWTPQPGAEAIPRGTIEMPAPVVLDDAGATPIPQTAEVPVPEDPTLPPGGIKRTIVMTAPPADGIKKTIVMTAPPADEIKKTIVMSTPPAFDEEPADPGFHKRTIVMTAPPAFPATPPRGPRPTVALDGPPLFDDATPAEASPAPGAPPVKKTMMMPGAAAPDADEGGGDEGRPRGTRRLTDKPEE